MHIHIATAGQAVEPVIKAFNAIPGIDKVYILISGAFSESAHVLEDFFSRAMVDVEVRTISGFDFQSIVDTIYSIFRDEGNRNTFSINITGGTNLMAAAACSTAFFVGAKICYVLRDPEKSASEQLIWIPTPRTPDLHRIKGKTQDILRYVLECQEDILTASMISDAFGLNKQTVSYHLRVLEEEGLLEKVRGVESGGRTNNRVNSIKLTGQGRLVASWLCE